MKYLFVDDTPEHLKLLLHALRKQSHEVTTARDLALAWKWLEEGKHFDLIVIDLALDRYTQKFAEEFSNIKEALLNLGYGGLPMSGQALGLRLWKQRKTLQNRYCYITNHPQLWISGITSPDPEFETSKDLDAKELVIDKASLWVNNIEDTLTKAITRWDQEKWLD